MNLCDPREINELLARHGFHFSRSMGQNFLIDSRIPERIAREAEVDLSCGVLEIGPGIGPLTVRLSKRTSKVVSVELDQSLLPVLAETMEGHDNVTILPGDVMKLDLDGLVEEHFPNLRPVVCANLPYNITTPLLTRLLECRRFASITVMVQKEAAQRVCARPGMAGYGHFSLLCQHFAACEILFDVPPSSFLPAPKVTSAVLRLVPCTPSALPEEEEQVFLLLLRAAFAQRRKTLVNCLFSAFGSKFSKDELKKCLSDCGLDAQVRGEELALKDFYTITSFLK